MEALEYIEQPPDSNIVSSGASVCRSAELNETSSKPPTLATANDVRELIQYLKQRPEGVNPYDVVQPIKKRIFYPTKIAAYKFWGLVINQGDRLKLSPLGWEFARSLEPEAKAYRDLLVSTSFYRAALEWISREELDVVTKDHLVDYWRQNFSSAFNVSEREELSGTVVTFFHLCQAAELGTMTIGKRGQPARLRVWRSALLRTIELESCPKDDCV